MRPRGQPKTCGGSSLPPRSTTAGRRVAASCRARGVSSGRAPASASYLGGDDSTAGAPENRTRPPRDDAEKGTGLVPDVRPQAQQERGPAEVDRPALRIETVHEQVPEVEVGGLGV